MRSRTLAITAAAAALVAAGAYGLYQLGMQRGMGMSGAPGPAASSSAAAASPLDAGPQSIAQGEAATRRHITEGVKAGDVDPNTGKKILSRTLSGVGTIAAYVVGAGGAGLNTTITGETLLRDRLARNIALAGEQELMNASEDAPIIQGGVGGRDYSGLTIPSVWCSARNRTPPRRGFRRCRR